jgi:hypothetical protein
MNAYLGAVLAFLMLWLVIGAWRLRRRRATPGVAAACMIHEMLNEERRAAVEIVLEERAAYHDPEDADGNLPQLHRLIDAVTPRTSQGSLDNLLEIPLAA